MFADYDLQQNHVALRNGLPTEIRETLLESTRSEWLHHPRISGKAGFFMSIHRNLLDGAAQLKQALEQLLDTPDSEVTDRMKGINLLPFSEQLIGFAHHHHEIEDHAYFPQFARLYPQLNRGLALLDGDHKVLDAALEDTQKAIRNLGIIKPERDRMAALFKGAEALNSILDRHIWDEEEVIIPVLLKNG